MPDDFSRQFLENVTRVVRAGEVGGRRALSSVGFQLVNGIKQRAPVDTGRLRASYSAKVDGNEVEVSTAVEYAPHQEYGTRFQRGTSHVRPAVETLKPRIPRIIADGWGKAQQ